MTTEAIVTSQLAAGAIPSSTEVTPIVNADTTSAAARFSELMSNGQTQGTSDVAPTDTVNAADAVSEIGPTERKGRVSLGDSILDSFDSVSRDFHKKEVAAEKFFNEASSMSLTDALRLQSQMLAVSVNVELVGKVVGKSVESVNKLTTLN